MSKVVVVFQKKKNQLNWEIFRIDAAGEQTKKIRIDDWTQVLLSSIPVFVYKKNLITSCM